MNATTLNQSMLFHQHVKNLFLILMVYYVNVNFTNNYKESKQAHSHINIKQIKPELKFIGSAFIVQIPKLN